MAPCPPSGNAAAPTGFSFRSAPRKRILQMQQMSAPRHASAADIGPGFVSSNAVSFGSAPGFSFGAVAPSMPSKCN